MKRWFLWFLVGLAVYTFAVVVYTPIVDAPRIAQLAATVAFRLWVYATGAALIVAVVRWLLRSRAVT